MKTHFIIIHRAEDKYYTGHGWSHNLSMAKLYTGYVEALTAIENLNTGTYSIDKIFIV